MITNFTIVTDDVMEKFDTFLHENNLTLEDFDVLRQRMIPEENFRNHVEKSIRTMLIDYMSEPLNSGDLDEERKAMDFIENIMLCTDTHDLYSRYNSVKHFKYFDYVDNQSISSST